MSRTFNAVYAEQKHLPFGDGVDSTNQFDHPIIERPPSRTAGHVRWIICAMLFFATSKNYMDRQVLGILATELQTKIGWSEAQYGYIVGAFQAAYAVGMLFAGWFIDRVGTRVGYALMMLVWSIASAAHALVSTVLGFGICRLFLGLGRGRQFPRSHQDHRRMVPAEGALARHRNL